MSHFLRKSESRPEAFRRVTTQAPIAAVRVAWSREGTIDVLTLDPNEAGYCVVTAKAGVAVELLPDRVVVRAPDDGEVIKPLHRFWVTTETINPTHLIFDTDHFDARP